MLTFPSYFRRERKEQPGHPSVLVTYRFDGSADDIYATLVVRLHQVAFESMDLWKSAADFKTQTGTKLGFTMTRESEGAALLKVYFEPGVDENSRAPDGAGRVFCGRCGKPILLRDAIEEKFESPAVK